MEDKFTLQPFFENIFWETISQNDIKSEIEFIYCFYEEWTCNFLHPFRNNLLDGEQLKIYAYYAYLAAQSNTFEWLSVSLLCGNYELVMRELRTILEVLFPAYYLDIKYPEASIEEKLLLIQELEQSRGGYGKPVFQLSEIDEWERYYTLYRKLCTYTHLSVEVTGQNIHQIVLNRYGESSKVVFNHQKFLACVEIWKEVVILAILLAERIMEKFGIECWEAMTIKRLF